MQFVKNRSCLLSLLQDIQVCVAYPHHLLLILRSDPQTLCGVMYSVLWKLTAQMSLTMFRLCTLHSKAEGEVIVSEAIQVVGIK